VRLALTRTVALLGVIAVASACGSSSTPSASGSPHSPSPRAHATPTVEKPGKSCRARLGAPVTFRLPGSRTVVRVAPTHEHVYTGRLATYASAHSPAYGYFLKIPVRLTAVGPGTWRIERLDFIVHTQGRDLTVDSGNGGFSGASHVITSTFLDAGDSNKTNIVIDSPSPHGTMTYEPAGKLACSWTF